MKKWRSSSSRFIDETRSIAEEEERKMERYREEMSSDSAPPFLNSKTRSYEEYFCITSPRQENSPPKEEMQESFSRGYEEYFF